MDQPISNDWRQIVETFSAHLAVNNGGLSSVRDLCRFLLEESSFDDQSQIMNYLQDYRAVSQKKLEFHDKWSQLRNMENVADYDRQEIRKIDELSAALLENRCAGHASTV